MEIIYKYNTEMRRKEISPQLSRQILLHVDFAALPPRLESLYIVAFQFVL